jgi:hypothetical protein
VIEIFTSGFFVGRPHEIGGGGAIILTEGQEVGRVKEAFAAGEIASSIAAELDVLSLALELARARGQSGEDVIVRTGYAALADLCRGRTPRAVPNVEERIHRLSELARSFGEVRAVVSPGWVTARPHDLAIRAVLDRYRAAAKEEEQEGGNSRPGAETP